MDEEVDKVHSENLKNLSSGAIKKHKVNDANTFCENPPPLMTNGDCTIWHEFL